MESIRCPVRVLIANSYAPVREKIARLLADDARTEVAGQACGVAETLAVIGTAQPNVVLLGMTLADGSALDVLRRCQDAPQLPHFIVLSDNPDAEHERAATRLGAAAFLDMSCEFDKIVALIDRLVGRDTAVGETVPEHKAPSGGPDRTHKVQALKSFPLRGLK